MIKQCNNFIPLVSVNVIVKQTATSTLEVVKTLSYQANIIISVFKMHVYRAFHDALGPGLEAILKPSKPEAKAAVSLRLSALSYQHSPYKSWCGKRLDLTQSCLLFTAKGLGVGLKGTSTKKYCIFCLFVCCFYIFFCLLVNTGLMITEYKSHYLNKDNLNCNQHRNDHRKKIK